MVLYANPNFLVNVSAKYGSLIKNYSQEKYVAIQDKEYIAHLSLGVFATLGT